MEKRKFAELGLSAEVLKAVDKMGFEEASPIQTAVIPLLLSGKDVIGQSSTGSAKTAAFGKPVLSLIHTVYGVCEEPAKEVCSIRHSFAAVPGCRRWRCFDMCGP